MPLTDAALAAIPAPLAEALSARGYETLTDVQDLMLDPKLIGRDLLVSARTGSGKTVAFGLALAETLLPPVPTRQGGRPRAVIIAPTRELALQVRSELEWLYAGTPMVLASAVGGMDPRAEARALDRGADILVGTPGRLCDHINRGALDLSMLEAIVLDEADEMLDLGFREDLEFILEATPEDRRTLLFSATLPPTILKMAEKYQQNAERVTATARGEQHSDIRHEAMLVHQSDRENAIFNLLRFHEADTAIVFCGTRAAVNHMTARLTNRGLAVVALSGEFTQAERSHALQAARDGRVHVIVATDVAARGIDLPGLDLVIHADLPTNPDTLTHRSGRTGRAGRKGSSVMIVPLAARRKVERLLGLARISADWTTAPTPEQIAERDNERLIADPLLQTGPTEDEAEMVARLIEVHGAETVAAAFLRTFRQKRAAPEDLAQVSADGRAQRNEPVLKPRDDFADGKWFSLSAGRAQSAEPRWIIPLLCRQLGITRHGIGAIRMRDQETFVELSAEAARAFKGEIGDPIALERGLSMTALAERPDLETLRIPSETERRPTEKRERWPLHEKPRRDRDGGDGFEKRPRAPRRNADQPGDSMAGKFEGRGDKADKPWSKKKPEGERGAFRPRRDDDRASDRPKPAKPYGDKAFSDRPKSDKPWSDKPRADRAADEDVWGKNYDGGDRKPARSGDDRPGGKPYAGKKPYGDKKPFGDKKPYDKAKGFGGKDGKPFSKPKGSFKSSGPRKPGSDRG